MPDREPGLVLRVLGTARLDHDGEPRAIPSARQRRILAVLAAAAGRPVSPDVLIDATWGEPLPAHPQAALHTQLTRVRRLLGERAGTLVGETGGYRLALSRAEVDAWCLEDTVAEHARRPGGVERLRTVLSWWDGEPFADAADHPAVQPAAVRIGQLRGQALESVAEAELAANRPDACLAVVEPLLIEDPFRERAVALLLRALYAAGRGTEALQRFQHYRRRHVDELGLEPSPALWRIEREILDHQPPATSRESAARGSLPSLPVSSFHGRHDELRALADLLQHASIVTVAGPGGAGKTRLALHAAHQLQSGYPDGVWWCDLLSAAPGETATTIASHLGLQDRAGEDALDRLTAYLADRRVLLVLDNCEHVAADTGIVVDALVRRGRGVRVLATSRQPLGIDGEHRLRLGPLRATIDGESPAVDLFVDRARAAVPGVQVGDEFRRAVASLCDRLGGLPLAIELAAASMARIDLDTLFERIDAHPRVLDRPAAGDRHHSLAGVVETSYRLLAPFERRLLDELSVFAGPFTLGLTESLTGRTDGADVAATIGALVDKSLVLFRSADGRYELLPPVKAVGRAHLVVSGRLEPTQDAHARAVLHEVARVDRALQSSREAAAVSVFDDSVADLRAARAHLADRDDVGGLVRLSASLHWFSMLRARSELYRWAEEAVGRLSERPGYPGIDRAAASAANGAAKRGDLARARRLAATGIELAGPDAPSSLEALAQVLLFDGDLDAAVTTALSAAERHAEAGDRGSAISARTVEAAALAYRGDRDDAEASARRCQRDAHELGIESLEAMTSYILAETIVDPATAVRWYRHALELAGRSAADFVTGLANTSLAALELRTGQHGRARRRLESVVDHWERGGIRNQQWLAIRLLIDTLDRDHEQTAAAILLGAYGASRFAGPAYGDDAERLGAAVERAQERLGPDRYADAYRRGATLTDAQAASFARALTG